MTTLVIAEHDNQSLKPSTLHVVTAAQQFNEPIHLLIAGYQCDAVVKCAQSIAAVSRVIVIDQLSFKQDVAESLASVIITLADEMNAILAPSNTFGKNLLPRVAAMLGVGQVSDVIEIVAAKTYVRPIYAGNILAKVISHDAIQLLTIRLTAFSPAQLTDKTADVKQLDCSIASALSEVIAQSLSPSDKPDLATANTVIAGGRGVKDKQTFARLMAIADRMGAAVGASRAAVDAGLVPNDWQVGQTGHVIAPKLYIAVGISGAIQHLAGMKDSGIIVAINKDPNAPIFDVADYGLVADLQTVLPEWEAALTQLGY